MDKENSVSVVQAGSLEIISRAEIDMQIATAHRYPRSLAAFKKRALEMVSLDEDTAESCIYRRPVGKKRDKKTGQWKEEFAEGMSIRMAEIVGACFGNLRVGAMIIEQTERYVKARGVAHDLESNFLSTSDIIESTVTSEGNPFSERMRAVVAKATLAKARRDATFSVVPRALCKAIEDQARKIAIGDATTLARRRAAVMQWIAKIGVEPERVYAALGIAGEADIGIEQLEILTGIKTAIKDGETTADEAFPKDAKGPMQEPSPKRPAATEPESVEPTEADKAAPLNEHMIGFIKQQLAQAALSDAELFKAMKVQKFEELTIGQVDAVIKWIKNPS